MAFNVELGREDGGGNLFLAGDDSPLEAGFVLFVQTLMHCLEAGKIQRFQRFV